MCVISIPPISTLIVPFVVGIEWYPHPRLIPQTTLLLNFILYRRDLILPGHLTSAWTAIFRFTVTNPLFMLPQIPHLLFHYNTTPSLHPGYIFKSDNGAKRYSSNTCCVLCEVDQLCTRPNVTLSGPNGQECGEAWNNERKKACWRFTLVVQFNAVVSTLYIICRKRHSHRPFSHCHLFLHAVMVLLQSMSKDGLEGYSHLQFEPEIIQGEESGSPYNPRCVVGFHHPLVMQLWHSAQSRNTVAANLCLLSLILAVVGETM